MPAAFGRTGFQPVHRTGKMPAPLKIFEAAYFNWIDGA
jgi:hypothetical protein